MEKMIDVDNKYANRWLTPVLTNDIMQVGLIAVLANAISFALLRLRLRPYPLSLSINRKPRSHEILMFLSKKTLFRQCCNATKHYCILVHCYGHSPMAQRMDSLQSEQ